MTTTNHRPLTRPLTPAEIVARLDDDNYVTGLVTMDISDAIDGDLEFWLDLCSEQLIGTSLGMDINYRPVGVQPDGTLVVKVTLDPSMALDDEEA